jgi:ATP-binding cassette, subfamily C (CFTR/MRP), member 1
MLPYGFQYFADCRYSAYFLDTVSGLSTIRAFGWTSMAQAQLHTFLDSSQRPYYFLLIIQQWLNLSLDLVVAVVAIVVVTVAVSLGSRSSSIGVALVQVISFNGILRQTIVSWTQMETSIAGVTRIKNYSDKTESEHSGYDDQREPPPGWPFQGKIDFKDASAVYQ